MDSAQGYSEDMRFHLLTNIISAFCSYAVFVPLASASIVAGDFGFIGFNADGNDDFAIVALVNIDPNTSVFFTDRIWSGTSFGSTSSNTNTITWASGASSVDAGTVISFSATNNTSTASSSFGSITSGSIDLNASNEALWIYTGSDLNPLFVSVIATEVNDINPVCKYIHDA
jgi:hypothetical protein